MVGSQPREITRDPISKKNPSHTHTHKRVVGVDQGVGREFNPRPLKKQSKYNQESV
jgi:hypothetical protein